MCWTGINKPLTVKYNEIVNVVKIVLITDDKKYIPYFVKTGKVNEYKQGGIYHEEIVIDDNPRKFVANIHQGIHSYRANMVKIVPEANNGEPYNQSIDYEMYYVKVKNGNTLMWNYSYYKDNDYFNYLNHKHICLLMGHLPAGTTYYVNSYGEVVSDALEVDLIRPFYLGVRY